MEARKILEIKPSRKYPPRIRIAIPCKVVCIIYLVRSMNVKRSQFAKPRLISYAGYIECNETKARFTKYQPKIRITQLILFISPKLGLIIKLLTQLTDICTKTGTNPTDEIALKYFLTYSVSKTISKTLKAFQHYLKHTYHHKSRYRLSRTQGTPIRLLKFLHLYLLFTHK